RPGECSGHSCWDCCSESYRLCAAPILVALPTYLAGSGSSVSWGGNTPVGLCPGTQRPDPDRRDLHGCCKPTHRKQEGHPSAGDPARGAGAATVLKWEPERLERVQGHDDRSTDWC